MRSIYVMIERRPWYHPTKRVKIGISSSPQYRRARVDAGIRGETVDLIESRKILFARGYERFLHWLFSPWRYTRKSKHPDIGRTEWFKLFFLLYWFLRFMILLPRILTIILLIQILRIL